MLAKLNYLFSKGCLKEKPIRTFYLIIRVLIADLLKKKINYIAHLKQSKFFIIINLILKVVLAAEANLF